MLTTAILDRDRLPAEVIDYTPPWRTAAASPTSDLDVRLRKLRAIVRQARGRAIRPRRARGT